ncbi:hypothetical protein LCGC14_1372420, partial [marine sediment metagenome]
MADTQRTRAALITLFGDNVTGQISAQDLRDFLVTMMESPEFTNAGDFFNGPVAGGNTTDKTTRGFHLYSQTMHSDYSASFGMPLAYNNVSGNWWPADLGDSTRNPARGIPADSYASGATDAKITFGGHDDPRDLLIVGNPYEVTDVHVHEWFTRIKLLGYPEYSFN